MVFQSYNLWTHMTVYENLAFGLKLRKIPKRTDRFDWGGYRFEVIDVDSNKVDQVLVTKLSPGNVGTSAAASAANAKPKTPANPQG